MLCNNLKRQSVYTVYMALFLSVRSIAAVPCTGISIPPCTMGDLLWFLSEVLAQTIPPLGPKNFMPMVHIALVYFMTTTKHKHYVFDYTSCTIGMVHDAVSIVWFRYELMIFSSKI